MNDLDERLTRAGEQFRGSADRPPSLDAMLDVATRPRHRAHVILPVAASVLAVAGVAIAVPLARSSGHDGAPTSAASPSGPPGPPGGVYVGDEVWSAPVLDESHPNVVYVNADQTGAQGRWGSACTSEPVARIISQTPDAVTVAVGKYAKPDRSSACADIGLGPKRLTVVLTQPLGRRSLVDATDGVSRQVLDPATVLQPDYLPPGYTGGRATWGDHKTNGVADSAQRTYHGPGSTIAITVGPSSLSWPLPHLIKDTTVRGHPATASYGPGFAQDILIAWEEDDTHAVTVYQMSSYDPKHPALPVDELIRIARSLH